MQLKLKNTTLLCMDKLLKVADGNGGIPWHFIFNPKEAGSFIKEAKENRLISKKHIEIKQITASDDIDIRFILNSELTNKSMHLIANKWFKGDIVVKYKGIEIQIVKKKLIETDKTLNQWEGTNIANAVVKHDSSNEHILQSPTEMPPNRIIKPHILGICQLCGSSVHRKWGVFGIDGCLQPECENYYDK